MMPNEVIKTYVQLKKINNTFQVIYDGTPLDDLAVSAAGQGLYELKEKNGVGINVAIVRHFQDDCYEIISGARKLYAYKQAQSS